MSKILAVIPTLKDDPTETIESINGQTTKVSKIFVAIGSRNLYEKLVSTSLSNAEYIYVKPDFREPLGKRVSAAINTVLAKQNLKEYDYLLKVDAEMILPACFIEENMKVGADFVASGGAAMLFKVSCFLDVFKGIYPQVAADDTFIALSLMHKGYVVKRWRCPPIDKGRKKVHHSYRHEFNVGKEFYRLGYEPIHVFERLRCLFTRGPSIKARMLTGVFPIFGYASAAFRRVRRYDCAPWVFTMQVRRLIFGRQFEY